MKNPFLYVLILWLVFVACKNRGNTHDISNRPFIACAPITTDLSWYQSDNIAPLIDGLDVMEFPVTTNDRLAQEYINQGMVLAYGFNHAEAARSFYYATKLDPDCAMAYWGFAYVLGPNYNAGMEPDNYQRAYDAVQKAKELASKNASQKEKDLINALSKRYVQFPVEDRSELDLEYSNALREVYNKYSYDADVAALYAESMMDMFPFDLWDENGNPRERTNEIVQVVNKALEIDPKHPGAHHFKIHMLEASLHPDGALESAKIFDEGLVPGAGHLIHMPSHVYLRTGDYHKGTLANLRAVVVDSNYVAACNAQGAYPIAYFPHNYHFLAATAALEGNSSLALNASYNVAKHSSTTLMKEPGWGTLQHFYTIPFYISVKFGKWEEILELENEVPSLKYPAAILNYARGMAFLSLGDIEKAKKELYSLETFAKDESLKEITIWDINTVSVLVQIARNVLKAEILAKEFKYSESISLLREAIEIEDGLNYNEPPDWFFSVRHHLGAIQIEAGLYNDAVSTYKEDLLRLPKNGWALHGLKLAYENLNKQDKVKEVELLRKQSWENADIVLTTSRVK
ncbi:hypothetical protein [Maribacter sp. 1_2014MBL_MicDiv]|uniref:hypothetical protein n=1 Tax=Maribacter sp. 1_2014MBL_MicDiv TaxID=1644130 RepID=UPI0008F51598|nr:hypothetical protein [Maribacter sp. 1_2014MBL_MicDiv]APA66409.1 hypothetical protein YQ22_14650 [Maribacter sp. 1_2014MBL_MicDiv]